jgi:hypothetical protein
MLVHEATYSEDVRQDAIEAFQKTVTSELEARVYAKQKFMEHVKHITAPEDALIMADPAARSALKALEPLVAESRAQFKKATTPLKHDGFSTFSITTHGGLTISVPPYDVQWTSSFFDDADKNAGTFTSRSIDSLGFQAAGLGVFVSTTIPERVRFSADAQFHSRWTDLVIEGAAITEGGVGVIVYEGGNVIARTDAQLWSDTQSGHAIHGASGDDVTSLTQTRAGQTYFNMLPGRQYLVWVWSWTTAAILGTDLAVGLIEAHMPFVVVEQQR